MMVNMSDTRSPSCKHMSLLIMQDAVCMHWAFSPSISHRFVQVGPVVLL